jgi:hypothetical protein
MQTVLPKSCGPEEQRRERRTHLIVMATLGWDAGSTPVRVRNMSARGALIDASVIPEPGNLVMLKRGRLQVAGQIAWAAPGQAGLAFSASVCVADWMASRSSQHQGRIDDIVSGYRSARDAVSTHPGSSSRTFGPARVEAELNMLRDDLERLGNGLASDVVLVATHPEIQLLDISIQRIERILRSLG